MLSTWIARLCQVAGFLPAIATAQNVFAHVVVGNNGAYTIDNWSSDISLAQSYGIEAFALNIAPPLSGTTASQISLAFQAANNLDGTFKLFFSFDYLGGGSPWDASDVISVLQDYGPNGAHFQVDGKPFVSTFEGTKNIGDWASIRAAVSSGIYFVPDWTSLGPNGFDVNTVDGAFSWNMWPDGANDVSTSDDQAWQNFLSPSGKSYMMGVSPWFYTDLPNYHKAWVWRGDDAWSLRWDQTQYVLPQFVEIVTWNDFGESHYIGPIYEAGIPSGAATYVDGYPHQAWLETLPYQISAYKYAYNNANPVPSVAAGGEKIVYWYRTSPASAGTTDATGNDCPSAINTGGYQDCVAITDILEDEVFAIVLASTAGTATISIAGVSSTFNVNAGQNFISQAFNGNTGAVSVAMGSVSGTGDVDITSGPASGTANYNTWVGCAGSCS